MLFLLAVASVFFLPMPWPILLVVLALVVEVAEYWGWKWFLGRYRIQTGSEAMIGASAVVVHPCDPEGSVRLRGEIWRARSDVPLEAGERAVVRAVDGLTLTVEPEAAADRAV